jgi:hypothetical protein
MQSLPALEHLLKEYYHETEWSDLQANRAMWKYFLRDKQQFSAIQLIEELDILSQHEDIAGFISRNATGATSMPVGDEARCWVAAFRQWCIEAPSNNSLERTRDR